MDMQALAKMLIAGGLIVAALGVVLLAAGHWSLPLGRLPGDIRVKRSTFRLYFPLTTSILVSVVLSLILFMISRFR
jgi:hypothetical protein